MTWQFHGPIFPDPTYQSKFSPAGGIHSGLLHLLWQDKASNSLLWASGDNCSSLQAPRLFLADRTVRITTSPTLLVVRTQLHALVVEEGFDGQLFHYQLDEGTNSWGRRAGVGIHVASSPAVAVFDGGKILCVVRSSLRQLVYTTWDPSLGWSIAKVVHTVGAGSGGIDKPTLITMPNGDVRLLYMNISGKMIWLKFSSRDDSWKDLVSDPSPSAKYIGTSCGTVSVVDDFYAMATFGSYSVEGVSVVQYDKGEWGEPEDLKEQTLDTPVLTPNPDNCLIACVFIGSEDGTLFYSTRTLRLPTTNWMSRVADTKGIWELSVPGTHDSAATTQLIPHPYKSRLGQYETQQLTIKQQLEMGIRFLDLRLSLDNGVLQMVHWVMRTEQTFAQVMEWLSEFLENNPSETIIVSIKNDTNGDKVEFEYAVAEVFKAKPELWFSGEDLPTLGEARGKIVLFRRYEVTQLTIGFDISPPKWPRNPIRFEIPVGAAQTPVIIQDNFDFINKILPLPQVLDEEWKSISLLLDESCSPVPESQGKLFINFLSASGPPLYFPIVFATGAVYGESGFISGMNQRLLDRLAAQVSKTGRLGILLLDYVNFPSEIIHEIINYNDFV